MTRIAGILRKLDWALLLSALVLVFLGLVTMKDFGPLASPDGAVGAGGSYFFSRQLVWLALGVLIFTCAALIDWSFFKTNSIFLLIIYLFLLLLLLILNLTGQPLRGAASWLKVYSVNIEPVELTKFILILVLAKYFSKRHVEIARFIHLFISSLYVALPAAFVFLQPDFGSAAILCAIWLGMAIVSGIKIKHLLLLLLTAAILAAVSWNFLFLPYQKTRILVFLSPQSDVRGVGYQATQSIIAIGSGEILGKGVGLGTQSRLQFLPEHATDFIFAAFAEEWGFIGVMILMLFLGILVWRILRAGFYGESNFEKLYAAGLAILISVQAGVHVGMNSGVLPITGLGMPFLSYGGSSLISLFFALGILESFSIHKKGIFIGSEEKFKEGILG